LSHPNPSISSMPKSFTDVGFMRDYWGIACNCGSYI
jgi:hypothetical protein